MLLNLSSCNPCYCMFSTQDILHLRPQCFLQIILSTGCLDEDSIISSTYPPSYNLILYLHPLSLPLYLVNEMLRHPSPSALKHSCVSLTCTNTVTPSSREEALTLGGTWSGGNLHHYPSQSSSANVTPLCWADC